MYVFTNKRSKQLYEMIIVDAAYIAAWMIDYCKLIGRKVVFEPPRLVFKAVLHFFPNESELWGSIASSMKFTCFLSVTKVQNLGTFSPIMSTKCKIFSRILYADQKRNIQLKPFFFSSPLFDLTLLPVYIITVIKVKLRVELYLFLLASKNSVIGNFRITASVKPQHII